jgi:hypothetical protein
VENSLALRERPADPDEAKVRELYNIPPSMDMEEASYLIRTILSFKYYQRKAYALNHERMRSFYAMPELHRKLIQPEFTNKLEAVDAGIEKNAQLANTIAALGELMYLNGTKVPMDGPIKPQRKSFPFCIQG